MPIAYRDIRDTLRWSVANFGKEAARRYEALIRQALHDIAADPERPGSSARPDLAPSLRTYHISFSRDRARTSTASVKHARHIVVYRRRGTLLQILRILHDARDLEPLIPPDVS
jgi:toxin ParE1/3/4